tara:strand:- start:485 stop:835 length:351 start_codon:yes stop_codon:yes gene_type:complete
MNIMEDKFFLKHAKSIKKVQRFFISEDITTAHFLLLTEIAACKIENRTLPNVKWLQTELQISFTKVKAIIESLEVKSIIKKIACTNDKRVRYIDLTPKGRKYIYDLIGSLPDIDPS